MLPNSMVAALMSTNEPEPGMTMALTATHLRWLPHTPSRPRKTSFEYVVVSTMVPFPVCCPFFFEQVFSLFFPFLVSWTDFHVDSEKVLITAVGARC
jgi:hypothetical protein